MAGYRQKCIEKKGRECKSCGSTTNIHAHHIDGDRSNNSIENLVPLCASCHKIVHVRDVSYKELGEIIGEERKDSSTRKVEFDKEDLVRDFIHRKLENRWRFSDGVISREDLHPTHLNWLVDDDFSEKIVDEIVEDRFSGVVEENDGELLVTNSYFVDRQTIEKLSNNGASVPGLE